MEFVLVLLLIAFAAVVRHAWRKAEHDRLVRRAEIEREEAADWQWPRRRL
jgi:hypothetical protein